MNHGLLTKNAFTTAIRALHGAIITSGTSEWENVKLLSHHGEDGLRFEMNDFTVEDPNTVASPLDIGDEHDSEMLMPELSRSTHSLTVDILHSPTYQVPVLYLYLRPLQSRSLSELAVIPKNIHISITDHPWRGTPVYFVHPCRSAETMAMVSRTANARPLEYLVRWLGLVGSACGIHVPLEVARLV